METVSGWWKNTVRFTGILDVEASNRGEYRLIDETAAHKTGATDRLTGQNSDLLAASAHSAFSSRSVDNEPPTEAEEATLRRIADNLPWSAFLVAVVELCERFTFYGLAGPLQNYISNSYHDPNGLPGAIGLGQTGATAIVNFFVLFCNLTPLLGAIVADQYLGKYRTIYYFAIIYMTGVFILFVTSLPFAVENGIALGGLIISMIIIGLGTGGIKSNVSPLIAEQYLPTKPFVRILESGERVIVDPNATIQRIYMFFYICINVGSLSGLATTVLELQVGFWSAYLLCFLTFLVGFTILVRGRKHYIVRPPTGSVIPHAIRVCWIGLRYRQLDAAKPENYKNVTGSRSRVPWSSVFIGEVRRALVACKVFLFFPIYWSVYSQLLNNFISQSGQMQLHGVPNDIMANIDPVTIIIFIPIMDQIVYPSLRRLGIPFKPISRIFTGFMFGAAAMVYAAGVQYIIYQSGPCYTAPKACEAALQPDGKYAPNNVHVALQAPAYILIGLSEIFIVVTGLEYAYTEAPPSMKSFITSLWLLTNSVGSAFGAALSPFAVDPQLLWLYLGLAIICFIAGLAFWAVFRGLNDASDAPNELEFYGGETPLHSEVFTTAHHSSFEAKRTD